MRASLSPKLMRWSIDQFNDMLDRMTADLNDKKPVVIAGDFNT